MSNKKVVRAIDVGFGNTKFTTRNMQEGFACQMFPSLAPRLQASMLSRADAKLDAIDVKVGDDIYIVGQQSDLATAAITSRVLDDSYSSTPEHMALILGALHHMKEPVIDILAVGLPLLTFKNKREELARRLAGTHHVPSFDGKSASSAVHVRSVRVFPQPVGTVYDFGVGTGMMAQLNKATNVVVDVGHGTIDIFCCLGQAPIYLRCGGTDGGVSKIIKAVARAISPDMANNIRVLNRIDAALRPDSDGIALIQGKEVAVRDTFRDVIKDNVQNAVRPAIEIIGTLSDVDHVFITGGGAHLYQDAVRAATTGPAFHVVKEPVYANVRGFQIAGQKLATLEP